MWKAFSLCLLLHFCTVVTVKPKIKLRAGGRRDGDNPGEEQIIFIKNVSHGFSKTFSSPSLISEAGLFINYVSVYFSISSSTPLEQAKSNCWWILFKGNLKRNVFLPFYNVGNKAQPLCKQCTTKEFLFWLVLLIRVFFSKDIILGV